LAGLIFQLPSKFTPASATRPRDSERANAIALSQVLGDDMMRQNWFRITFYGSFVLLFAACNQAGAPTLSVDIRPSPDMTQPVVDYQTQPAAALPTQETQLYNTQMTQAGQATPSSGLEFPIEKAKEDLAQRLAIEIIQISLVDSQEVVWADSSLGCPHPGRVYSQVLTSGLLIHLEADGKVYEYHADFNEQVIPCEDTLTPISPVKPGEIQDGQPWMR
jgi:hypothetical protein